MRTSGWTLGLPPAIVAIAVCSFVTFASADPAPPPDTAPHLVIVPDSPRAEGELANSAAREVARYASFTLVEATGDDVSRLTAAGGSVRDDMREVRIGERTSDPTVARPSLLDKSGAARRTTGKGGSGLAVVQYVGPIKDEWIATVRKTGVEVVSYMAQNGQLVSGDSAALSRLAALLPTARFVRAVTPYTAADKRKPGLDATGRSAVVVTTVTGEAGAAARALVEQGSQRRRGDVTVGNFTHQHVTIDASRLAGLAELGGVVAIEPAVEPKLLDERAATIVSGALSAGFQPVLGSGYRSYLSGKGFSTNSSVVVDISDEGIDKGIVPVPAGSHPDFYRLGSTANPSRLLYAHEATAADANARDCGGHGTNVASIATGYNAGTGASVEDAQGFNYGLGIAPFAKLGATKLFNCAGAFDVTTSLTALHSAAYGSGARVSNNSWGANVAGAYNADAQEFDGLVRDVQPAVTGRQPMVEVFSAGNSGSGPNTIGSPGTAKNVITVGASENARPIGITDGCGVTDAEANSARDIIDFSSRGPTDDGRVKPDIVAPGTHVTGAQPQTGADYNGSGTCNPQFPAGSALYSLVSGTSQAAPEVTGFAALLREWYPSALGGGSSPSPAMTKALMVNTASDVAGGADGAGGTNATVPTQIQGWGRINLGKVLDGTFRQAVDQTRILGATGSEATTFYNVASSARPLKVTLAWTDAPGPTTGAAYVNDLDLEVTAGGTTYKGNVFSGGVSAPGGTGDPRNNLENVFLPVGAAAGSIRVRVIARNIAGDALPGNADATDQDYALVVSNVGARQVRRGVLSAGGRSFAKGGDGDDFIEPGESFTVKQSLHNVGNAPVTGVSGTLAGTGISITTGSSTWPNLAAASAANNTPAFRARVTASCGTRLPLVLHIASSVGPADVPFAVQTGRPSATVTTRTSTDVPKAIPDNNTTGATSTLVASATSGSVSDLDVTIGQITHTFVGDLVIDLTSPQGTTVRLTNRNGGGGDSFTNTVLDDEAATSITTVSSANAPFTGSFRPFQPLSAFDGQAIAGTWTLRVADHFVDDVGTLSSWNTKTKGYTC